MTFIVAVRSILELSFSNVFYHGNSHGTDNCVVKHWHICRISEKDCLSLQAIKHTTIGIRDASLTAISVSVCDVLRMQSKLKFVYSANFNANK
nr:MAG TPA: hypothetical protein [Caudoviricetes sp.]